MLRHTRIARASKRKATTANSASRTRMTTVERKLVKLQKRIATVNRNRQAVHRIIGSIQRSIDTRF